ncbi:putative bifunctional diguanylate cyclase/phosphodiesterase [Candidatus Magnetomonas plexicatena]|uniref:putative bifunctional diguanylate cyclase/phosphodiesterase n=1 Tax=Candidatus Magnetomonas plexicatena TaxID=2552947 RepID=UPI001C756CC3|nr:bifunctional diguanylate cyclase/phosphodiesterase [Nitrospirales bacterium LBB_01]
MKDENLNFSTLRCQLSRDDGTVLESLIRESFLIEGIDISIRNFTHELTEKVKRNDDIAEDLNILVELTRILLGFIAKSVDSNEKLIMQSLFRSLRVVDALEKSSVDTELLEKFTQVLTKIVLSRDNVIKWEKRSEEILKELYGIYPFDFFFNIFESKDKVLDAYMFLMNEPDEKQLADLKSEIHDEVKKCFEISDILDTIPMEFIPVPIFIGKGKTEFKEHIMIHSHEYLTETPGIGGILGMGVFHQDEMNKRDMDIIDSLVSIMTMVTGSARALSKAINELEFFAGHDPLTGLYNRRMFEHFLDYEIARVKRKNYTFSLMMQDLDDFKYVNDNYGHPFGDLFLKEVANTLQEHLRDGDVVARLGGDEFAVILSETDISKGKAVAEKLRQAFEHKKIETPDKKIIPIKASIGLVEFPTHGSTAEELMVVVDAALYNAKELGKNKVFVPTDTEIKQSLREQTEKFNLLQDAIEDDRFVPYYQPIFDVATNKIAAFEVLARLIDKDGNVIPAYKFIDMAERIGKIFDIDRMVIRKAFRNKKLKNNHNYLFVNISGKELKDRTFLEFVIEEAKRAELDSSEIVIEITEREAAGDLTKIQEFLQIVISNGFKLAIDDFGSGYSSFYYLKYLPANFLKIDGEFIKELATEDPRDYAFVESIQTLCKKLNILTVAEFVESSRILEIVAEIGITYGQGFHIGMPHSDFV